MGGAYALEVYLGGIGKLEVFPGRLDPSDAVALKGEYYDTHSIDITTSEPFVVELVSLGFDGYLVKPISLKDLEKLLAEFSPVSQ